MANILVRKAGCYSEDFRIAALLHDIGKIGINRSILFKPAKLNDLEYIVIQAHSHNGNTIIRKKLGLTKAAGYVRDHHERWDGRGYPRGLRGDQISIEGKIINLCDAFDTMTNERRTYQQVPMSFPEAYAELRNCAWTQFDGSLVEMFIGIMEGLQLPNPDLWYSNPEIMKAIFAPNEPEHITFRNGIGNRIETEFQRQPDSDQADETILGKITAFMEQQTQVYNTLSKEIHQMKEQQVELKRRMDIRDAHFSKVIRSVEHIIGPSVNKKGKWGLMGAENYGTKLMTCNIVLLLPKS